MCKRNIHYIVFFSKFRLLFCDFLNYNSIYKQCLLFIILSWSCIKVEVFKIYFFTNYQKTYKKCVFYVYSKSIKWFRYKLKIKSSNSYCKADKLSNNFHILCIITLMRITVFNSLLIIVIVTAISIIDNSFCGRIIKYLNWKSNCL